MTHTLRQRPIGNRDDFYSRNREGTVYRPPVMPYGWASADCRTIDATKMFARYEEIRERLTALPTDHPDRAELRTELRAIQFEIDQVIY